MDKNRLSGNKNFTPVCKECTGGLQCEFTYKYLSFSMSSSMSVDMLSEVTSDQQQAVLFFYTLLLTFFVFVAIINNVICIETFISPKIRMTTCGVYLLIYSTYSIVGMCLLEIITIITLFFNDQLLSHSVLYCNFLPGCVNILFFSSLWTSSFLAVERTLIECFNSRYSLYRTRLYSILASILLLIILSLIHVSTILGHKIIPNPVDGKHRICVLHSQPSFVWKMIDKTLNSTYLHYGLVWLLHLLSALLILYHIVRHKVYVSCLTRSQWPSIFLQQVRNHKDFLIPPILILLCTTPHTILLQLKLDECVQSNMKFYLRFHLLLDFFLYLPQIITFFVYLYPSGVYRMVYYNTSTYRKIHSIKLALCCR
jgi:hypothetical protein